MIRTTLLKQKMAQIIEQMKFADLYMRQFFPYEKFKQIKGIDLEPNIRFNWPKGIIPNDELDQRYSFELKKRKIRLLFNQKTFDEQIGIDISNYIRNQVLESIANNDIEKFLEGTEFANDSKDPALIPLKVQYIKANFGFKGVKTINEAARELRDKIEELLEILKKEEEEEFQLTNDLINVSDLSEESRNIVESLENFKKNPRLQVPVWFNKLGVVFGGQQLKEAAEFYLEENNSL
jgi:signal transduction histidine kinase